VEAPAAGKEEGIPILTAGFIHGYRGVGGLIPIMAGRLDTFRRCNTEGPG
jgi:hypothetical protein